MGTWNIADVLGLLFLGYGLVDGYRKGLVKKGTSLMLTLVTLFIVYISAPYVGTFIESILPEALSLEKLANPDSDIYKMLVLSGVGGQADQYIRMFVARVLAIIITYLVVRLLLRTLVFSLEILTKVPGLSFLNRLGGAGLGILQQLITLWLLLLLVALFSGSSVGNMIYDAVVESSWLYILYENNLLFLLGILLILKI